MKYTVLNNMANIKELIGYVRDYFAKPVNRKAVFVAFIIALISYLLDAGLGVFVEIQSNPNDLNTAVPKYELLLAKQKDVVLDLERLIDRGDVSSADLSPYYVRSGITEYIAIADTQGRVLNCTPRFKELESVIFRYSPSGKPQFRQLYNPISGLDEPETINEFVLPYKDKLIIFGVSDGTGKRFKKLFGAEIIIDNTNWQFIALTPFGDLYRAADGYYVVSEKVVDFMGFKFTIVVEDEIVKIFIRESLANILLFIVCVLLLPVFLRKDSECSESIS